MYNYSENLSFSLLFILIIYNKSGADNYCSVNDYSISEIKYLPSEIITTINNDNLTNNNSLDVLEIENIILNQE